MQGSGFRVQGAGCGVQGAGCRVQGSGCRVSKRMKERSRRVSDVCAPMASGTCTPVSGFGDICVSVLELGLKV